MNFFRYQATGLLGMLNIQYGLDEAEKTQLSELMNNSDSFKAQQLRTTQLAVDIVSDGICAFEVFLLIVLTLRLFADWFWTRRDNTRASTNCLLVYLSVNALVTCSEQGNMFTNAYCRDNPTDLQIRGNAALIGVMLVDTIIQLFLVRDFDTRSGQLTIAHHFLAMIGALGGIYIGGVFGAVSNFILITEVTTPMVNTRWLLHFHEQTHLKAYLLSIVGMTVGFLVIRIFLMVYLGFFYLIPAILSDHFFKTNPISVQFGSWMLFCLHISLLSLNTLWFSKMVTGIQKFRNKKAPGSEKGSNGRESLGLESETTQASQSSGQKQMEIDIEATVPLLAGGA